MTQYEPRRWSFSHHCPRRGSLVNRGQSGTRPKSILGLRGNSEEGKLHLSTLDEPLLDSHLRERQCPRDRNSLGPTLAVGHSRVSLPIANEYSGPVLFNSLKLLRSGKAGSKAALTNQSPTLSYFKPALRRPQYVIVHKASSASVSCKPKWLYPWYMSVQRIWL